jgi:N-acetylglucosamine kinase-like BadF-type ATPase
MTAADCFLAIDGGNSKTDILIGDRTGQVLAYVRGPGTCYQNIGVSEMMSRLVSLVQAARHDAGIPDRLRRAEVYLAGADLPAEVELLRKVVAEQAWADELRLDNDTFALLRAGTQSPDAIAVVCGAGINCVGRRNDGRITRFPALGRLSGDWGGGGHVGWLALWHAIRAEDGRGPATALTSAVAAHYGHSTVAEVAAALHFGGLDDEELPELTPLLCEVAQAGDPVAGRVVARQAQEIVLLADVAARRLELTQLPHTVVLGGGVLRARWPVLNDAVLAGLVERMPHATVTIADAPPVVGAALFALEALGSPPAAHAKLRADERMR